jgi:hypothetical protein
VGLSYLNGKSWAEVTREERVFCQRPWLTIAWCTGILLVSIVLCSLFFQRRTA